MNLRHTIILLLYWCFLSPPVFAEKQLKATVELMRGMSMQLSPTGMSDGRPDTLDIKKREILAQLAAAGPEAIAPLADALKDKDVQMRRNACLALINLAGTWTSNPRVDIKAAYPALLKATSDEDMDVRRWAAQAISINTAAALDLKHTSRQNK